MKRCPYCNSEWEERIRSERRRWGPTVHEETYVFKCGTKLRDGGLLCAGENCLVARQIQDAFLRNMKEERP